MDALSIPQKVHGIVVDSHDFKNAVRSWDEIKSRREWSKREREREREI
jgi:hypothetical protein